MRGVPQVSRLFSLLVLSGCADGTLVTCVLEQEHTSWVEALQRIADGRLKIG